MRFSTLSAVAATLALAACTGSVSDDTMQNTSSSSSSEVEVSSAMVEESSSSSAAVEVMIEGDVVAE